MQWPGIPSIEPVLGYLVCNGLGSGAPRMEPSLRYLVCSGLGSVVPGMDEVFGTWYGILLLTDECLGSVLRVAEGSSVFCVPVVILGTACVMFLVRLALVLWRHHTQPLYSDSFTVRSPVEIALTQRGLFL